MAYPVLTGAVLVEANGAALNNAGADSGIRADNAVVVKQIQVGRLRYPYVSGQAWRRWWREVLYEDFGWNPSPVTRLAKQVYTSGDPVAFEDDDLFGYMVAKKRPEEGRKKGKKGEAAENEPDDNAEAAQGGTYRRISPLKNSLLISVLPNVIERDFGTFTRNLPPGTDPVPYETEHYSTYLQGVFTISLSEAGKFKKGEMNDLSEDIIKKYENDLEEIDNDSYRLPSAIRIKRIQDVLKALARLRGGAHLARNLSDVGPVVVLVGFVDGGNAPFQRLFEPDRNNERIVLNLARLRSVLDDCRSRVLMKDGLKSIYFGFRPGVLANESEILKAFNEDQLLSSLVEIAGTPVQALEKAAEYTSQLLTDSTV